MCVEKSGSNRIMTFLESILSQIKLDYFALFLIICLGILAGRIKIKGISLDVSAVIFIALIFGHLGITLPDAFQKIGLLLFIYSVGIQAGPGFFSSFQKSGRKLIIIAVILVVAGAITTIAITSLFGIDTKLAVGLFAGALTSTPGLAAAIESIGNEYAHLASIGYGIAYPFGVIGVILYMNFIPYLFKINIKKQEENYKNELKEEYPEIIYNHFVVENPNVDGKTIAELKIRSMTEATVSRILHQGETILPKASTILHKGDLIRAVGTKKALQKIHYLIGPESDKVIKLQNRSEIQWIIATNKKIINKTLGELRLFENYGATITRIRRSGIDIQPNPSSHIRFGDKLLVACQGNIEEVSELLGNEIKKLHETDILPIALGIVLGILAGMIEIPLPGGINFKLGLTGGVLTSALLVSRLGKTGPVLWNISGPANQLIRQFGLLFFLAAVGTDAGANLVETISNYGAKPFVAGAIITILPLLIATFAGKLFFKMNFLRLLGALTGGMTSTPGLTAIDSVTESDAPSIAYATVYPIAMVVLIICIQILGRI